MVRHSNHKLAAVVYPVFLCLGEYSGQAVKSHGFARNARPAAGACVIFLRRPMPDDALNWCVSSYSHNNPQVRSTLELRLSIG